MSSGRRTTVNGALLVYHRPIAPWKKDASTVREHLHSFARHSRHRIWEVNIDTGFPPGLRDLEFRTILLHYSVFGMNVYHFDQSWSDYLKRTGAYKVAFFQDECTRCARRFAFLNDHAIDCVYTCLEPAEFGKVYERYTSVSRLVSTIPGYVSDELIEIGRRMTVPFDHRTIDVGYRSRPLPSYFGRGGMEKHTIGVRFGELAAGTGLRLDLATTEGDRLYGTDWYAFMANCRAVLGVESGVSVFDLEDEVFEEYTQRLRDGLPVGLKDLTTLPRWEDRVYYRTISPRHFEAAALRVCQVLFEGRYSGVLQPMVHYIPLRKDFSNFEDVIALIRDDDVCRELTENAYRDLIASGKWSYARFVAGVDEVLAGAGLFGRPHSAVESIVDERLSAGMAKRRSIRLVKWILQAVRWRAGRRVARLAHPVTVHIRARLGTPGPKPTG